MGSGLRTTQQLHLSAHLLGACDDVLAQPADVDAVLLALVDRELGVLGGEQVVHFLVVQLPINLHRSVRMVMGAEVNKMPN